MLHACIQLFSDSTSQCSSGGSQAALADRLSAVLTQLSPDVAHTYFTVFFRALREEWFGIDRLRLDKFMLLIRRMLRQLFRRLHSASWCGRLCITVCFDSNPTGTCWQVQ